MYPAMFSEVGFIFLKASSLFKYLWSKLSRTLFSCFFKYLKSMTNPVLSSLSLETMASIFQVWPCNSSHLPLYCLRLCAELKFPSTFMLYISEHISYACLPAGREPATLLAKLSYGFINPSGVFYVLTQESLRQTAEPFGIVADVKFVFASAAFI